jgi:APA family basic amino acid/polyamine antiporter
MRGRSPLVLVPIANPASAAGLVGVASTVRTPGVGRILLLSVVETPSEVPGEDHHALLDARAILGEALQRSFERSTAPETLFTIAADAWQEIPRVAALHRCETVVLGSPRLDEARVEMQLEGLISRLGADVVIVRAKHRWRIATVRSVLAPIGGRRHHSQLRARLLASLSRAEDCRVVFLRAVSPGSSAEERRRAERELRAIARDEAGGAHEVLVEEVADPREAILRHAEGMDLVVMGIRRDRAEAFSLGDLAFSIARESEVPLVLISARQGRVAGRARERRPGPSASLPPRSGT